jgi:hypothetical protein
MLNMSKIWGPVKEKNFYKKIYVNEVKYSGAQEYSIGN